MSAVTPELDEEAIALLDMLPSLADEIVVEQTAQDERFARRLSIFLRLTEKGVTQSRIADAAKITPMAVSYALGAHRRKQETAKSAARPSAGRAAKASR